jgi:hypothetical protein
MNLETKLSKKQIDAAKRFAQRLEQRQLSYAALVALHEKLPGYESKVCLLKSAAVNAIYGTNIRAIVLVALYVEKVLCQHGQDLSQVGARLVIDMADVHNEDGSHFRNCTSFASKFCHFFVAAERFPMYDEAAREALKLHFGKRVQTDNYETFCSCVTQLRIGIDCDTRALDDYLWLTGMYVRYSKQRKEGKKPIVNAELRALFDKHEKEQFADLDAMLPAGIKGVVPELCPFFFILLIFSMQPFQQSLLEGRASHTLPAPPTPLHRHSHVG